MLLGAFQPFETWRIDHWAGRWRRLQHCSEQQFHSHSPGFKYMLLQYQGNAYWEAIYALLDLSHACVTGGEGGIRVFGAAQP